MSTFIKSSLRKTLPIILIFSIMLTPIKTIAADEAHMSNAGIAFDLKPSKSKTVSTKVYGLGYKNMSYKISNYEKIVDEDEVEISFTLTATIPWKLNSKMVDKCYKNTSKRYSICTWGSAFVDYNTGLHYNYDSDPTVDVFASDWKHQQKTRYKGTHGNTVDVYRKNVIKYTIICPIGTPDICFGVYGSSAYDYNLKPFFKGSAPFRSTSLYSKKKKLSHWMKLDTSAPIS